MCVSFIPFTGMNVFCTLRFCKQTHTHTYFLKATGGNVRPNYVKLDALEKENSRRTEGKRRRGGSVREKEEKEKRGGGRVG